MGDLEIQNKFVLYYCGIELFFGFDFMWFEFVDFFIMF